MGCRAAVATLAVRPTRQAGNNPIPASLGISGMGCTAAVVTLAAQLTAARVDVSCMHVYAWASSDLQDSCGRHGRAHQFVVLAVPETTRE
jgi:hypothetical protein